MAGIFWFQIYFSKGKTLGLSPWLMDRCSAGPWWPAGGGAMERGVHGESISGLTGAQAAVWRPGDSGEETAEEALGVGSARAWREEKESGEMCGGGWRGSLFI
jgi:hypothetical protein